MAKKVRRISRHRVSVCLRKTNARLSQEIKLEEKIAKEQVRLESLREKGVSGLVLKMQENKLTRLNSELNFVRSRRLQSERVFGDIINRNNGLNVGNDDSSSSPSSSVA